MTGPINIPTMDEILKDPAKAASLPPETKRTLLYGLAGVLPVLLEGLGTETGQAEAPSLSEEWLTVKEVMQQYKVEKRWLYARKKQLPFIQPSRKKLLFDRAKLAKWFANQKH